MKGSFAHPKALVESTRIGDGTRVWAYAHVMKGAVIGKNCNIGDHAFVESGVKIGNGVTIKNGVAVWEGVTVEDFAFLGPFCVFTNDLLPRSPRFPGGAIRYKTKAWVGKTRIGKGASIGANATIVCGHRIGEFAMIGAGSVVTANVPPHALWLGVPGRLAGYVCECGTRLVLQEKSAGKERGKKAQAKCTVCKKRYALRRGKLARTR